MRIIGTVVASGTSFPVTSVRTSQRGVPIGEVVAGFDFWNTTSQSAQRSPIASASMRSTGSPSSPGSVRTSMSIVALSGMTLILTPDETTFGENVVRVEALNIRSTPRGSRPIAVSRVVVWVSANRWAAESPRPSTKRCHRSWIRAGGR